MKKLSVLAVLSLILLGSECLYRHIFNIPSILIERLIENYLFIFFTLCLFSFSKYRLTKAVIFLFFVIATIGNNIHFEVYKSHLTGLNYYLALKEFDEVILAGSSLMGNLIPHILWGIVDCLLFLSVLFLKTNKQTNNKYYIADLIFLLIIIFVSAKNSPDETITSPKTSYGRLKVNYNTLGHFIGKIIPSEVFGTSRITNYLRAEPKIQHSPQIRTLVFIVGESAAASHLSAFGYHRKTSPFFDQFLNHLSEKQSPVIKKIYAAGTSTQLSLPPFFNAVPYPNGYTQINRGDTNLFRLAKKQGFTTYFYSSQPEEQMGIMNLIGRRWIDDLRFPTSLGYSQDKGMPDENLLPLFYDIDLSSGKHLIILHQRGSHMPDLTLHALHTHTGMSAPLLPSFREAHEPRWPESESAPAPS